MLSATGSTGRKNGAASFNFFNVLTVDCRKRYCWRPIVDSGGKDVEPEVVGGIVDGGGGAGLADMAADAGGGVADFQKSGERQRGPDQHAQNGVH